MIFLVVMRPIDSDLSAADFVVVEVAHGGGGGICVLKVCKAEAFWFAGLVVHHESEFDDWADSTEDVDDLFFREIWER